jgi:beta-glucosidase
VGSFHGLSEEKMDIKRILSEMTLEEKASLCSGGDFWRTKAIDRLGVPKIMVSDGPHGLRKQIDEGDHVGINDSIKAVCFPTGSAVASSFDTKLINEMGESLGESCQAEDLAVLLGPAVNIKRSPLCGRNFEYFSEDPYLSAEMAVSQIKGIQSKGVGTSIKHFLANSQEHRRLTSDSRIDERTLREIYLPTFERAVKEAQPWTVMCSYNSINGDLASENYHFLTEILREEWGFEGFVVSDWGAVNNRVKGLAAGLDLEMPSSYGFNDALIVDAVKKGNLDEKVLDNTVKRFLRIVDKYMTTRNFQAVFNREDQHQKAREIAGQSMVLLKNDDLLPLSKKGKIAFIGAFAENPRFQGGGSSHINTFKTSNALNAAQTLLEGKGEILYAPGYSLTNDTANDNLIKDAVTLAKNSDMAVIFAGLPDSYESEGYDRKHMKMPESHNRLIEEISRIQPNTVVVLHNGSPVEMPWIDRVPAVLEAYLSGQATGEACVDILFGLVNPSGKLAETFPVKLEDNPSFLYYLGEKDVVEYREGVFVGYRYYDKKKIDVLFPFGHGLSYTNFTYSDLKVSKDKIDESDSVTVSLNVANNGSVFGQEVVQLYINPPAGDAIRPVKELKGFAKVALRPGETERISFVLDKRSFAYFNTVINDWFVESGEYRLLAASSSRDIRLEGRIQVESKVKLPVSYDMNTLIGDLLRDSERADMIREFLKPIDETFMSVQDEETGGDVADQAVTLEMKMAMFDNMPLRNILSFGGGKVNHSDLNEFIQQLRSK